MPATKELIEFRRSQILGEVYDIHGPLTLRQMSALFEDYRRCVKLAEHNRSGRNPSYSGAVGRAIGASLQCKADRLARSFPSFPETLKLTEK